MPYAADRVPGESVARRALAAAFVGLVLPLLAWGITLAGLAVVPYDGSAYTGGWGRVGQGMVIVAGAVPFLLVVAWPLLWVLRVRPAWHVALTAPIAAAVLWIVLNQVDARITSDAVVGIPAVLAVAYGAAALFTTAGTPLWWWQQLPLMAVGGPAPIPVAEPRPHLPDVGIPLIAPDLPAYTVERVSARPGGLRYLLRPSALHHAATPAERDASTITVIVGSRVDPPGEDSAYEPEGPRTWRRVTDEGTIHVVDRDDATVMLKAGPRVPAPVLAEAVATLRPRPPSHFTSGGQGS
ncbi:hypothetical protein [Microbispora sp. NPDC049125]|uniref:hypothetical protein n=1 Tax=Microbispora sp. NPDC049125 TaxID=3154929 RepID=UPI0034673CD6